LFFIKNILVLKMFFRREKMNKRFDQLDSLRGLAAFSVFTTHLYNTSNNLVTNSVSKVLFLSPLKIFVNGHADVILFFVLSGFVLSLPLLTDNEVNYSAYLVKRVFRIYVPYIVAIGSSMILCTLLYTGGIKGLSPWFNAHWKSVPNAQLILEHLFLIGNYKDTFAYNSVIWSLIQEMRISLIFPFVVLIVKRFDWKVIVPICLVFTFIGGLNNMFPLEYTNDLQTTDFCTIHYLSIFMIGSMLAKYRSHLIMYYNRLPLLLKGSIFMASFVLFNFTEIGLIKILKIPYKFPYYDFIVDYGSALGASGFIIVSICSVFVSKLLMKKPILFLGKISYSFYLLHVPVLLSICYLFYNSLPMWLNFFLAFVTSVLISTVAWRIIEKPCIAIGRKLATKLVSNRTERSRDIKELVNH
jgi:peptidoglycan/LPS O-acetylase OafA/YrhL